MIDFSTTILGGSKFWFVITRASINAVTKVAYFALKTGLTQARAQAQDQKFSF